ncbi:MAG: transposase [Planctomycetia bacterium]|nr:transposase [Planctomycetia bacterium]
MKDVKYIAIDEIATKKRIRYILLKRPENLDPNKGEPQRLERALKMNEDLSMIYYLKEELHTLWEEEELEQAQGKLLDLIVFMESTQHNELKRFIKSLRKHAWNILNWYDYPITTGRLEEINNKIKTLEQSIKIFTTNMRKIFKK